MINPTRKPVRFALFAPYAHAVTLAGNFNDWNPSSLPLTRDERGLWQIEIYLEVGRYEYKFVVDGDWRVDPECALFVATAEGHVNCVTVVE